MLWGDEVTIPRLLDTSSLLIPFNRLNTWS
jgi:hypothetical protein